MTKLLAFFLVLCGTLCAQSFGAGVKVGAPFTDAISIPVNGSIDTTVNNNDYIIGPYGEVRLPGGFSVEIDALYRGFSSAYLGEPQVTGGNWEFPVMAKYKVLKNGPLKPYIEGGLSDELFVCIGTVEFGCIEERDAFFIGCTNHPNALILVGGGSVVAAGIHAAESHC
jgi:hypothetical protein